MTDAATGTAGVVDDDRAQARVAEMLELLRARAPVLRPNITPRPFKHVASSRLLGLCKTAEQRTAVQEFLVRKAMEDKGGGDFGMPGDGEGRDGGDVDVVLKTEIDLGLRTFRITGAKMAGKIDATLHDLERLMDLQLNGSEGELEPYVSRFALANELPTEVPAAPVLHEVCGVAYALQVAASYMPGWTGYVGTQSLPITADVDISGVLRELFEPQSPTPPSQQTEKKTTRKKRSARTSSESKPNGKGPKDPELKENTVVAPSSSSSAATPGTTGAMSAGVKGSNGEPEGSTKGAPSPKNSGSKRKKR